MSDSDAWNGRPCERHGEGYLEGMVMDIKGMIVHVRRTVRNLRGMDVQLRE